MATILVVDDRSTNRQFLLKLLSYGGHTLLEAENGLQALELTRARHPDLVITDILMPLLDGYQYTQDVRSDPQIATTPVIFYTATYLQDEAALLGRNCGVTEVLLKPSKPQVILDAVSRALSGINALHAAAPVTNPSVSAELELQAISAHLAENLEDLRTVRLALRSESTGSTEQQNEGEHIPLVAVADKYSRSVADLRRISERLYGMIELRLRVGAEREPARIVETFFICACKLIDSRYAGIGMLDESGQALKYFFAKGVDTQIIDRLCEAMPATGLVSQLANERRSLRREGMTAAESDILLSLVHPSITNLLAVPIAISAHLYGWLYFADKAGADAFSEADEKLAALIAEESAVLYENAMQYHIIQRHAAELQIEITERKKVELKVARLSRIHEVLSGINSAIVRIGDRQELFDEACRIAVEHGKFSMAWLGLYDANTHEVKPITWQGENARRYLDDIKLHVQSSPSVDEDLLSRAIREQQYKLTNDPASDLRPGLGRLALECGYRSIAAFPLMVAGRPVGVLSLYTGEIGFFDEDEIKLLEELAGDISFALDHIEKAEKINYFAYYDTLTGLANRTLFHNRVNALVLAAASSKRKIAIVLADLEQLHIVNETFGRQVGDTLIVEVARYLRESVGEACQLARISAEHFALVLDDVRDETEIASFVEKKIVQCLKAPITVMERDIPISVRVSVALFPADGATAETLVGNAEAALKRAKNTRQRLLFYAPQMNARLAERFSFESSLRLAIEREQFVLHYQPKTCLKNGHILGMEALIRWNNPDVGLVPPVKFIPILEETGMILEVGAWALRKAAMDYSKWREQGLQPPCIAVNVSPVQLRQSDFVATVLQAAEGCNNGAPGLAIEITESELMEDFDNSVAKLKMIRVSGIEISMDDFGTGYSSLSYFSKLPIDTVKIDRSFIVNMETDQQSMSIVSMVISLAHTLNIKVVAEGVETNQQAGILRRLNCDEAQGYLFSKPLPHADAEALLRDQLPPV
jgi:diguanylate cyclase (GGDEF)-like protein